MKKLTHLMTNITCLLYFIFALATCNSKSEIQHQHTTDKKERPEKVTPPVPLPPDSLTTLTISSVGDLMCHSTQYKYAYKSDGTYDFAPVYDAVREYLSSADITTGNLETVLAGKTKNYGGYPAFNTPNDYADGIKSAGFDIIITSNNHALDQGEKGVERTLKELKKRALTTIGTFSSQEDRDSIRVFMKKNIKFTVLAYTQFSNRGYPSGKKYLLNFIDSTTLKNDIQKARRGGAEIVMINFHWGNEYQQEPSVYQKNITNYAVQCGADIIIGHHPHCLQPFQKIAKKSAKAGLDTAFVAYSLGNFYSNQRWRFSDAGAIVTFRLTKNKNTNKITLQTEYVPTWLFKGKADNKRRYIILPAPAIDLTYNQIDDPKEMLPKEMKFLTPKDRKLMKQANLDCQKILGNYGVKLDIGLWSKKSQHNIKKLPMIDPVSIQDSVSGLDTNIKK